MNYNIKSYIECLLDEAELPALGRDGAGPQNCDPPPAFESLGFGGTSGTTNSGESSGPPKSGNKDEKNSRNSGSKEDVSSENSSGGRGALVSRRGGRFVRSGTGATDGAGSGPITADAENRANSSKRDPYLKVVRVGDSSRARGKNGGPVTGLAGFLENEREKVRRRENKVVQLASRSNDEGLGEGRSKRSAFKPQNPRSQNQEVEFDSNWSLGKLFRILLMIIIAIALVLFVAGQMAQISKSAEK